jgi:hypothetical protein
VCHGVFPFLLWFYPTHTYIYSYHYMYVLYIYIYLHISFHIPFFLYLSTCCFSLFSSSIKIPFPKSYLIEYQDVTVLPTKCFVDEIFCQRSVLSTKCFSTKVSLDERHRIRLCIYPSLDDSLSQFRIY